MKQLYTTLALFVVAAGIGGWIYFNERGPVAQTGSAVLLRVLPQNVNSLTLESASQERLEITRQNEGWQVHRVGTKSVAVPADSEAIDQLLAATQLLQSGAVVQEEDASKLDEFGLEKPAGTLIVNEAKIEFGKKPTFDPSKIYTRVTNNSAPQIALLPASLAEFVAKPFNDWRDKSALRVKAEDVTQLLVNAPAIQANFERILKGEDGEPDQWLMKTPVEDRADAGAIRSLLEQLSLAKAPRFLEDNPQDLAKWGLEKPVANLEVVTPGGKSTLRIGKVVEGGRAAQNSISRVVFVAPESLLDLLSRPHRDWRDKQILRFSIQDVENLKVSARGREASLQYDGSQWNRAGGVEKDAKGTSQAALDILIGLQGLTAQNFINRPKSLSPYGLDKPVFQAELSGSAWNAPKTIQIGNRNGKIYAHVAETGDYKDSIYVLPANSLDAFKLALNVMFPPK